MAPDVTLLNTITREKNEIYLTLSLYLYKFRDGKVMFGLCGDYLGYSVEKIDDNYTNDELGIPRFGQILTAKRENLCTPMKLNEDEYEQSLYKYLNKMEKYTFEDVFDMIYQKYIN